MAGRATIVGDDVDFEDTPEEAAFRAEARAFLEAHASPRTGTDADWSRGNLSTDDAAAAVFLERTQEWQATLYDNGWAGIAWPKAFGGRGSTPAESIIFGQELAGVRRHVGLHRRRPAARRSADHAPRLARAAGPLPQAAPAGRGDVVPAVQRARRRQRPQRPRHPGRARRRRVGGQRPEGVDVVGPPRRLRHPAGPHRSRCAQAQGHHLLHRRHAHAGHRHPPARPGHRARRTSARSSSPTSASRPPTWSARSTAAGRWPARRWPARPA